MPIWIVRNIVAAKIEEIYSNFKYYDFPLDILQISAHTDFIFKQWMRYVLGGSWKFQIYSKRMNPYFLFCFE